MVPRHPNLSIVQHGVRKLNRPIGRALSVNGGSEVYARHDRSGMPGTQIILIRIPPRGALGYTSVHCKLGIEVNGACHVATVVINYADVEDVYAFYEKIRNLYLYLGAVQVPAFHRYVEGLYGALTCHDFLASGTSNMAVIIWWLRGHHAGKTGNNSFDPKDVYAGRLGFFCRNHPGANLIETSEQILGDLDRGI